MVFFLIINGQFSQHVEHAPRQCAAHRLSVGILLEDFPRHVQWQICGIHHTFDKALVQGEKLLRVIHNEYPLHV